MNEKGEEGEWASLVLGLRVQHGYVVIEKTVPEPAGAGPKAPVLPP